VAALVPPQIDYLSKDYASFRRLMLDRLATLLPSWSERHSADVGVMLVELLSYAADQISYMQDAVATEAYLVTARRRISARRHARLLDYAMHDGCNARAFVAFQVGAAAGGQVLHAGTGLLTQIPGRPAAGPPVILLDASQPNLTQLLSYLSSGAQAFETMHDLTVHPEHNLIFVNPLVPLVAGATSVVLSPGSVQLFQAGDLMLVEQTDAQGNPADPAQRQVVRLTGVAGETLSWSAGDAVAFTPGANLTFVVRGNVALCDHGLTLVDPTLTPPGSEALSPVVGGVTYRPTLRNGPVTQQGYMTSSDGERVLFDPLAPASAVFAFTMDSVLPALTVTTPLPGSPTWQSRRDLVGCAPSAALFVAEVDDDGRTILRFGDGVMGQVPAAGTAPLASYRAGNGAAGNVGADTLVHPLVASSDPVWGAPGMLLRARNPLPAEGGTEPDTVASVQINAPGATRLQMRAVTELDHASVLLRNPEVKQALAVRRYNGSFYTVVVAVQRAGGVPANAAFLASLRSDIEPYRLAGWDIQILGPTLVPLDVMLTAYLAPGAHRVDVLGALQQALGVGTLPSGLPAFFCADNFSFGQTVYFSQIVAAAMQVPGVRYVDTSGDPTLTRFQRTTFPVPYDPIHNNAVTMRSVELPALGSLVLNLRGGQ
jgi:hypothetical protein